MLVDRKLTSAAIASVVFDGVITIRVHAELSQTSQTDNPAALSCHTATAVSIDSLT